MNVRFSYLKDKFPKDVAYKIFDKMWSDVVSTGDFTLGKAVTDFEKKFAALMSVRFAVGVANGTDALELSLLVNGIQPGDEVIAPANTFVATLGAIGNVKAVPVLVDIGPDYVMNADNIERVITKKTKAIMPVHFTGEPCDMDKIMMVAKKHNLMVIEDACQAYLARFKGRCVGTFGNCGAFSLHPLKILNCWGDGGVVTTNDERLYKELKLLQNHGMQDRDTYIRFPCRNSRLDSIHAVVCNMQLDDTPKGVIQRRKNAKYYDDALADVVYIPPRSPDFQSVFHLYMFEVAAGKREPLYRFLVDAGIEAKVHYRTPLYLQQGLSSLGYQRGQFPVADDVCDRIITIPVDENVTKEMQDFVIAKIKEFMAA